MSEMSDDEAKEWGDYWSSKSFKRFIIEFSREYLLRSSKKVVKVKTVLFWKLAVAQAQF